LLHGIYFGAGVLLTMGGVWIGAQKDVATSQPGQGQASTDDIDAGISITNLPNYPCHLLYDGDIVVTTHRY
jgi:hypothetical protein